VKKIIINSDQWQTRVAIIEDNEMSNIYFEPRLQRPLERAFFKGRVSKVLPGIQTAFVDIGQAKAGFLHISEIDRDLAVQRFAKHAQLEDDEQKEPKGPSEHRYQKPNISTLFKEGEPLLVQVSKEPVYEKGAKLTTCFTLPGRFLVLMPNIPKVGISKKIENPEERARLKVMVKEGLPEGMGAIIRTCAENAGSKEISKDLAYLIGCWREIEKKFAHAQTEEKIYEDVDLVLQIVRDHLDDYIDTIVVDNEKVQTDIYKFIRSIMPEYSHVVKLYTGSSNIFEHFGIEKQIHTALDRKVHLKSGGSLIIETTEAMTVIDVNTGKFIGKSNLEETIVKTNLEAVHAIVQQLRLRNIGGIIVIDFIDMSTHAHKQKVFKTLEKVLKEKDKFQSVVLKISEFGLVQMTRKRSGKTLMQQLMHTCTYCQGLGYVKSTQTLAYDILRHVKQELLRADKNKQITIQVHPVLFNYISSSEYQAILDMEKTVGIKIMFATNDSLQQAHYLVTYKE
jgi:ribonuclease G